MTCNTGAASRAAAPCGAPTHGSTANSSGGARAAHPAALTHRELRYLSRTAFSRRRLEADLVICGKTQSSRRKYVLMHAFDTHPGPVASWA